MPNHHVLQVSVIGYDSASAPPSGRDGGGGRGSAGYSGNYGGVINDEFGATDYGGGGISYSQIAGAAGYQVAGMGCDACKSGLAGKA